MRKKGILQGCPLSPTFGNLYLAPFDKWLDARGTRFCRYSDDILVCFPEQQEAEDFYPIMEIALLDNARCQITISHKYALWEAIGEYDAEFGSISYEDGVYSSRDRGSDWEIEETGCSGWIFYDSPGLLRWFDNNEGIELYFVPYVNSTDE